MKKFSIVSYLSGEEYKKVRQLQKEISQITGSKKCLEDWLPHITIGEGVVVSDNEVEKLERELSTVSNGQSLLHVSAKGFGGLENWKDVISDKITPYVIWIGVEMNQKLLNLFNDLKSKITSHYDVWLPIKSDHIPHITLAFADLTREGYEKGIDYLSGKEFKLSFDISHLALVECYGEGDMTSVEYKKFYFNK